MLQRSFCLATVDRGLVGVPAYHSVRTLSGGPYVLRPGGNGSDGRDRRITKLSR